LCYFSNSFCIKVSSAVSVVHQFSKLRLRLYAISCFFTPFGEGLPDQHFLYYLKGSFSGNTCIGVRLACCFFKSLLAQFLNFPPVNLLSLLLCQLAIRVSSLTVSLVILGCDKTWVDGCICFKDLNIMVHIMICCSRLT